MGQPGSREPAWKKAGDVMQSYLVSNSCVMKGEGLSWGGGWRAAGDKKLQPWLVLAHAMGMWEQGQD